MFWFWVGRNDQGLWNDLKTLQNHTLWAAQEPTKAWEVPRVSPYRLAAHLTSAFAIFGGLLWTALSVWTPEPVAAAAGSSAAALRGAASLRRWALPVAALIALTACSGARGSMHGGN